MGKGKSRVEYKGESFTKLWNEWKEKAESISGATMGVQLFTGSLYEMLAQHGITGRIVGNSGPKESPGLGKELAFLDKLSTKPSFSREEKITLTGIIGILNSHGEEQGDLNPRNIRFDGIDKISSAERSATKKPVYGHYRTPNYVKFRRLVRGKDELDAVDTGWFDASKGIAKPPMWQAIYGNGGLEPFTAKGLTAVVTEAVKGLEGAKHHIIENDPVAIENKGAAKFAYNGLSELRTAMDRMANDPAYTTSAGNFATTKARTRLMRIPYNVKNNIESNKVKILLDAKGVPGSIEDFYIYISRRQINHMARLAGWEPPKKKEPKEETDEKLTSYNRETRDWRTIMKVMA